jgi:hypothetical protein
MTRALIAVLALALILPAGASAKVSFSVTHYGAGNRPTSVAVGDFNRDGDPDLAPEPARLVAERGRDFGLDSDDRVSSIPIV